MPAASKGLCGVRGNLGCTMTPGTTVWPKEVPPRQGLLSPSEAEGLDKLQVQELLCLGHSSVAFA